MALAKLSTDMALLAVVARVSMTPALSAPSIPETFVGSLATAVQLQGPTAYFSTLPIKAMVRNLRTEGIPASVSNTAGTFVCNHVFYALMHHLAQATTKDGRPQAREARGGFIHVPALPELAARHPGMPSMALATQVRGLQVAIETALSVADDVREVGGALH